jgi:hypothetical protein
MIDGVWKSGGEAPYILNFETKKRQEAGLIPQPLYRREEARTEAGCASQLVCAFWRNKTPRAGKISEFFQSLEYLLR